MSSPPDITVPQTKTDRISEKWSITALKIISIIQIIFGFTAAMAEIKIIKNGSWPAIGTGIWTGVFFGISGSIGLLSIKKSSRHKYEFYLNAFKVNKS